MQTSEEARQKRNAYMREYYKKNKERMNEHVKKWRNKNPEKIAEYQRRHWKKKLGEENEQSI